MLDKTLTEQLLDNNSLEDAIGMISALAFHRLLKKVNVVIHDIDLETNVYHYGTFLLEKPKEPKAICKISLETAVTEILYTNIETKEVWGGYRDFDRLTARITNVLKPRVRLAEILSAAGSLDEAQERVESEFGSLGKKMLIIRKGA